MNKVYGFEGEVLHKLDGASMRLFEQCFCCLPLSALIENQVFCVHGGLASEVNEMCEVGRVQCIYIRMRRLLRSSSRNALVLESSDLYSMPCHASFVAFPSVFILRLILPYRALLLPQDGVTIADINKLNRFREPPESGLMCDLLWADPHPMKGRAPSKRGVGLSFGPDVTDEFLKTNHLKMVR